MQVGTVNDNKNTSSTRELREKAGIWLRTRRENLGLSQRVLADRVNMEYYTFISQIESGKVECLRTDLGSGQKLWRWTRKNLH